jgi:hypothetical protein
MADRSDDEPLNDDIVELYAMVLALRDVVARLTAYEAMRHPDGAEELFREIAESSDAKVAETAETLGDDSPLGLEEGVRRHIDLLIQAARAILP